MADPGNTSSVQTTQQVDLMSWPGWVELESEPAYFNVLLKDIGVRGIKIQEIFALEADSLADLPEPVHAVIFLFRYKESIRADPQAAYPEDVWFARQTANNACGTHAILNIVNNISGLDVGERLREFRFLTKEMTPEDRGHQVDQLHFVRAAHNSFATENDIIAADQYLQSFIETSRKRAAAAVTKKAAAERLAAKKAKQATAPVQQATRSSQRRGKRTPEDATSTTSPKRLRLNAGLKSSAELEKQCAETDPLRSKGEKTKVAPSEASAEEVQTKINRTGKARRKPVVDTEAAYHFCAYMPINEHLWKLDGLEPTPEDICMLGPEVSWLNVVATTIQERMASYDDTVEFSLMAVVRDPLVDRHQELDSNIKSLQAVEKLDGMDEDWRERKITDESGDTIQDTVDLRDTSQANIDKAEEIKQIDNIDALISIRMDLVNKQAMARANLQEERAKADEDEEKAFHRRHDYGAFVRRWMELLVEQTALGNLLADEETK